MYTRRYNDRFSEATQYHQTDDRSDYLVTSTNESLRAAVQRMGISRDALFAPSTEKPPDKLNRSKPPEDKRQQSFTSYAKSILKHSLITSFPEIAGHKSWIRRSIKMVVFVACVIGFVYQTLDFLNLYYSYPTVVNVEVFNPFQVKQPAITVCNRNRYRRSAFCEVHPERCTFYTPQVLCHMYERICESEDTIYPGMPVMYVYVDNYPEWESAFNYSHTSSIVSRCVKTIEGQAQMCDTNYHQVPAVTPDGDPNLCYTIESQWGEPDSEDDILPNTFTFVLDLNTEPEEYTVVTEPITIQLAIHDRRKVVNPYAEGYALAGGSVYDMYVSMSEKELLPKPYATNCTDYMELWKARNGTGPLNEMMCIEECKLNTLVAENKCIDKNVAYPHTEKLCPKKTYTVTRDIVEKCTLRCGNPCNDQNYELRFEEVNNFAPLCNNEWCKVSMIRLNIFFKRFRVTKFKHEPKFAEVEMFSYIGGYMGMWLGLSLVSLFDLFETITALVYFPVAKQRQKRKATLFKTKRIRQVNHF